MKCAQILKPCPSECLEDWRTSNLRCVGEKGILAASFLVHQSLRVTSLDGYWHALHWQGASALVTSGELCRDVAQSLSNLLYDC